MKGGLHGNWRGLSSSALWEGRDLPVLNDYRDVAVDARGLISLLDRNDGFDILEHQ